MRCRPGHAVTAPEGRKLCTAQPICSNAFTLQNETRRRPFGLKIGKSARKLSCIKLEALGGTCPWRTLGVSENADAPTIRRAYRRLALRYHPDVDKSPEAPNKFVAVHDAYEVLLGRKRGKEAGRQRQQNSGWDFHDWFWGFKTRKRRPAAAQQASQPLSTAHLEGQLQGLRRKAASRRAQQQAAPAEACFRKQQQGTEPRSEEWMTQGGAAAAEPASATKCPNWAQGAGRVQNCSPAAEGFAGEIRAQRVRQCGEGSHQQEVVSNAVTLHTKLHSSKGPARGASQASSRSRNAGSGRVGRLSVLERPEVEDAKKPDSALPQTQRWEKQVSGGWPEATSWLVGMEQAGRNSSAPEDVCVAPDGVRGQLAGLRRRAAARRGASSPP